MKKNLLWMLLWVTFTSFSQEIKITRHFAIENHLKENTDKYVSLDKLEKIWEEYSHRKFPTPLNKSYQMVIREVFLNSVEDQLYLEGYILRESKSRNAVILTRRCHGELL